MIKHGRTQEKLRKEYADKGYTVSVEASVPTETSFYVVDILARKGKETIVIEIGNVTDRKLSFLKKKFTKVIHIPYTEVSEDGYIIHHLCGYKWRPRKESPKACPRCKTRLDLKRG